MRRRKYRRDKYYGTPQLCVAFGAGLLLARFGSVHLALFVTAIALIVVASRAR